MFAARGRLVTESFARDVLPRLVAAGPPAAVRRAFGSWAFRCDETLGPASSARAVADVAAMPLLRLLGFDVRGRAAAGTGCALQARAGDAQLAVLVSAWGEPLTNAWRPAVLGAIAEDAGWCLCCNGRSLRLVDGRRTWSRDYLELDVPVLGHDPQAQWLLWSIVGADAVAAQPPLLDRIAELSHRHGVDVCRTLGKGVLDALHLLTGSIAARTRHDPHVIFEQSLTVLYRLLFLLFAEARGLLPLWHPVYRERYSLEAIVSVLAAGQAYKGLWHALRAISRLAHAGVRAGELRVTAFNGRLFSPMHATAFDTRAVADTAMNQVLVAVATTTEVRSRVRTRIAYRDLDVEQLGSVYEQVLEYEPCRQGASVALRRTGDARKATGTFYTPRAVTAFLVQRTLEPLVRGRTAAEILALRVLDPAMGSGAFLVAACRYLARVAEDARVAKGTWQPHEVTAADRAALRRDIAARCLFGVDVNPTAVQLGRLSLWLASLAGDKPLSFLDHHLISGDSLVGATPDDVRRSAHRARHAAGHSLPLFDESEVSAALEDAVRLRLRMTDERDDSAAIVRSKEKLLAALQAEGSPLGRWSRVLDVWCARWFRESGPRVDARTFREVAEYILHGRSSLPERTAAALAAPLEEAAATRRFVHWPLAFPEIFIDAKGEPLPDAGFDAVIGNPPWDMVRGDSGDDGLRTGRRAEARQLTRFVRQSGIYRVATRAHVNRYQLFVERALQLTRSGGRIGLALPSGVASDTGSGALRRHLFDCAQVDEMTGVDNRNGIFPIHRGLRFLLMTATRRGPGTGVRGLRAAAQDEVIRCRFGITRAEDLERGDQGRSLRLTRRLLARLSGEDDLGIPELTCERDLRLLERICATIPRIADEAGWSARFGRELNASDDRGSFTDVTDAPDARPVVEGKLIEPFRVSIDRCRLQVRADAVPRVKVPRRPRIAYRDVASAGNRLTLIAAIVPARAVTTHTLFCLRTPLPLAAQHVLCALLNSFVANYLIRLRVGTHVTLSLVSRLPVPFVDRRDPSFDRLSGLSAALMLARTAVDEMPEYAALQALAARLYGLDAADFEHVLGTFPLVPLTTREAALRALGELP